MAQYQVLIIGGGTAGITVAAMLRQRGIDSMAIIEPSEYHYYQPIWTLVGGGVFGKEGSQRKEADYIPEGVDWIKDFATGFDPDKRTVTLSEGDPVKYEVLVVAAGIQIDWDKVPGLRESVGKNGTGVCSNYSYDTVESTWDNIRNLKSGTAIFTHPSGSIKCGGAPMKIAFLACDYWRKRGVLKDINVVLTKPGGKMFSVEQYRITLQGVADRYGIEPMWNTDLTELRPDVKEAVMKNHKTGEETILKYDMIHVTPYQSAPDFIKNSSLANDKGWVDVDKFTTQHVRYPEIFALGDSSGLPTSKTGAAVRKQAPVTVRNILSYLKDENLEARYDGYTSCPVVTGYGKLVMAEFDYDGNRKESFPFDQSRERYSMYALKAYGLPQLYWNGMLRGREF